jgi:uncharacterized protein
VSQQFWSKLRQSNTGTTLMLEQAAPMDEPKVAKFWMFRGPAAYVARTPWPVWPAVGGAVGVMALTVAAVTLVALVLMFMHPGLNGTWIGLIATPFQQLAMIAATLWLATLYAGKPTEVLALQRPAQGLKAYVVSFLVLIACVAALGAVIKAFDPGSTKENLKVFAEMFKSDGWWIALLMVGVGAPLSEELLFRGFLFPALAKTRLGLTGAALLTSAPFAHIGYSYVGMVQVFVIGLVFSWMLIRTGSLRVTMACHALYNTLLGLALMGDAAGWM